MVQDLEYRRKSHFSVTDRLTSKLRGVSRSWTHVPLSVLKVCRPSLVSAVAMAVSDLNFVLFAGGQGRWLHNSVES